MIIMSSKQLSRLFALPVAVFLAGFVLGIACLGGEEAGSPARSESETRPPPPIASTALKFQAKDPGIYDDRILFGQSAAFSGPASELGKNMRLGIQAAFHEVNQTGGVHGRRLELESLDDQYEPDDAFNNTQRLIRVSRVFALIGEVGTPTSRSAAPVAGAAGAPFVAPFTGAEFLRDSKLEHILNLRASYYQETEEMVARLTEDLGITRIAVLYQNDSFGESGLQGTTRALERRGLAPVASAYYQRNTSAVKTALNIIEPANPEALVIIGSYAPAAQAIKLYQGDAPPVFMVVSFAGGSALLADLGPEGAGVYVTQVVPLPEDDDLPIVARYHTALADYDVDATVGFVSLEGYLAGRLAIAALEACGPEVSRDCFLKSLLDVGQIDFDGFQINYGPGDNQGSDAVFLTVIGSDGKFHQINRLGNLP